MTKEHPFAIASLGGIGFPAARLVRITRGQHKACPPP